MNADIQPLIDEVTEVETVVDSATAFVSGVPVLIQKAVDAAVANGATAEQLAPVVQLGKDLKAKSDLLAAAILANTPAQP